MESKRTLLLAVHEITNVILCLLVVHADLQLVFTYCELWLMKYSISYLISELQLSAKVVHSAKRNIVT